jgi:hypothetical protein
MSFNIALPVVSHIVVRKSHEKPYFFIPLPEVWLKYLPSIVKSASSTLMTPFVFLLPVRVSNLNDLITSLS